MPVFNKMVYNGTEYILGGGGNIGEPLNLTVTTSGLDATIKWEDNEIGTIPPTTFQKSELVRKIGSAPTSPSDGDLVVTETVKDTYKVSGYVDQGLTDGETYYYRVFSYSDLGGISYCDAVSVTPSSGWQPGVDTLVYCELNGNINNTADTGYVMSSGGNPITYTTVGGIQVGYFDGANIYTNASSASELNGSLTYNLRVKNGANFSAGDALVCIGNESTYQYRSLQTQQSGYRISGWYSDLDTSSGVLVVDSWQNVAITINPTSGAREIYINGVLSANDIGAFNAFTNSDITIGGNHTHTSSYSAKDTYLSRVIIENKVRTAQEISDYYDQTKGDYGIS